MDLWHYGLSPQEFMAAHYLQRVSGRASGREVADHLGISERGGRRVLTSLVEKGLIQRVRHGRFALLWLAETRPLVAESRPWVAETKVLSSSRSTTSTQVGMSNDIPTSASRPLEGEHIEKRFPLADDLEPGRLKPKPEKSSRKTPFKMPDKYHRITQPREEWGVPHVVKEFHIRYQHAFPESIYVVEGKSLSVMLNWSQSAHGITVPQMLTALDQFFTHHAHKVGDDESPTRAFLGYFKRYIQEQPGYREVEFDPDNATTQGDEYE